MIPAPVGLTQSHNLSGIDSQHGVIDITSQVVYMVLHSHASLLVEKSERFFYQQTAHWPEKGVVTVQIRKMVRCIDTN